MANFEWKDQYPGLADRLAVLDQVELPASLSSGSLFEKMDRMERAAPAQEPRRARVFRWRPVMSYAAAFLLLVAVYYGVGLAGDSVSMAPAPAMPPADAGMEGRAALASSGAAPQLAAPSPEAYAMDEAAAASLPEEDGLLMQEAPSPETEEYGKAAANTVLVIPALAGEPSQGTDNAAQMFAQAELVAWWTLSQAQASHYREEGLHSLPWGEATLAQVTYLKGEAQGTELRFSFAGGYVPATEYYEQAARASANVETVKEGLEGKYVKVLLGSAQPDLVLGRQYLVMLIPDGEGLWQAAPLRWTILEVADGIVTGPEGESYGAPDAPDFAP